MQCPSCRKIEKSQWPFANGCWPYPEFSMDDWAHDEDLYDLSYTESVQEVFDEPGFWGFWKGVFSTLIMVSNPSIQFMLYETLLKMLKERRALSKNKKGVTALEVFLVGALAKLGATVVTYPLLVVKDIYGNEVPLSNYKCKVLLIVNVASKWINPVELQRFEHIV